MCENCTKLQETLARVEADRKYYAGKYEAIAEQVEHLQEVIDKQLDVMQLFAENLGQPKQ